MEKIVRDTKCLPNKLIISLNFDYFLTSYNGHLYILNKNNLNLVYKNHINNILIKSKSIYSIEKYYKVKNYFILIFLMLLKENSINTNIFVVIHGNKIIPKDFQSVEKIKKGINIICNKIYIHNIFICFFDDIVYVGANDIDLIKYILDIIKIHGYVRIINNTKLKNHDFKIIYKKITNN